MALSISVVIPAYNAAVFLAEAVESVLAQSYGVCEIIVVDDGSDDGTEAAARRHENVRYFRQEHRGPSAARNRGIIEASGDLVAFLDADDIWMPEKIELQVEKFMNDPRLGLCASASYLCGPALDNKRINRHRLDSCRMIRRKLVVSNLFATPTVMVRRHCFEKVGLFDESLGFGEDWDMWLRVGNEFPMTYLDRPLCYCRAFSTSITRSRSRENLRDWERLITLNRERLHGLYAKSIGYCRSMSWYRLNCAYDDRYRGNTELACRNFLKSIWYWPFNASACCKGIFTLLRGEKR